MKLLCDTADNVLETLKKYNFKNKELIIDDATATIIEIIFSDQSSISLNMIEQPLNSLETIFFSLAEKYYNDVWFL